MLTLKLLFQYSESDLHCIDAGAPCGLITNIDAFVQMTNASYSGPGGWNDADMLQVCNDGHLNGGMNLSEYQAELSMWYANRTVAGLCDIG